MRLVTTLSAGFLALLPLSCSKDPLRDVKSARLYRSDGPTVAEVVEQTAGLRTTVDWSCGPARDFPDRDDLRTLTAHLSLPDADGRATDLAVHFTVNTKRGLAELDDVDPRDNAPLGLALALGCSRLMRGFTESSAATPR